MKNSTTNSGPCVLRASGKTPIAAMHGTGLPFAGYGSGLAGVGAAVGADAPRTRTNAAQDPPRGRPV